MLAIRMQRTGRHGHAQYRVVVQDSRQSPKSGKVVARLGSYNPHTKENTVDKEKAQFYLEHGAQPSDRVVSLLKSEGVKMPDWVSVSEPRKRTTRNPDKLRKNQPAEEKAPEAPEAVEAADAPAPTEAVAEAPAEKAEENPTDENADKA